MVRLLLGLFLSAAATLPTACSDLDPPEAEQQGIGGSGELLSLDPDPETAPITLACTNNRLSGLSSVAWRLTVDPGPILGGAPFGAQLKGEMTIQEALLAESFSFHAGGYKRLNILDARATVHVRSGVTMNEREDLDVLLVNEPIPPTCTYDSDGQIGLGAGPFPTCSLDKNDVEGKNADCTGLGGGPNSENSCGQFVDLNTEDDCERCGKEYDRGGQCGDLGFCVAGDLSVPLVPRDVHTPGYVAAGSGNVLFGWDDQIPLDSGPVDFRAPPGPNGFRILLGGVTEIAFECTMIASGGASSQREPAPDSDLIAFEIQTF